MRQYASPADFRAALEARLRNAASARGVDLGRLRRQAVFERILVRLEQEQPGAWVVKGGIALELRMPGRARATRDLDLALREPLADARALHAQLVKLLSSESVDDGFRFRVERPTAISPDEAGRPGWRASVEATLAGRTFQKVRLDVVARPEEIAATERIVLPGVLSFAGLPAGDVEVVAPAQQFAEKLHALTRTYGERENSRVRDLVDEVLLIEAGLDPSPRLRDVVRTVFAARESGIPPPELPAPSASWRERYEAMASELELEAASFDGGVTLLRDFWRKAHATGEAT